MARPISKSLILIFVVLVAALFLAGLLNPYPVTAAYADGPDGVIGEGTEGNPYRISSVSDWFSVAVYANTASTAGKFFSLTQSIDMAGYTFIPLGADEEHRFQGKFSGNGNVIENIFVDTTGEYAGVFGYIGPAGEVKDLGVFGGEINGQNYAGGIAGMNLGTITRCFNTADVNAAGYYAGGIAGYNTGVIINCYNQGDVSAAGLSSLTYAGGLVGYLGMQTSPTDPLSYSYSLGAVSSTGYVGGVAGGRHSSIPAIRYCYYSINSHPSGVAVGSYASGGSSSGGDIGDYAKGFLNRQFDKSFQTLGAIHFTDPACQDAWHQNYSVNDFSAFFAPALKVFSPGNSPADYYSYNSVIIRLYGIGAGSGDWGTETNPYLIATPEHLVNLSSAVNNNAITYYGKFFLISEELDFTGVTLRPVGDWVNRKAFSGTFDGGNKVIKNLVMNYSSEDYIALFNYIGSGAVVKNIIIAPSCSFAGRNYVASVAGYNNGSIINAESRALVRGTTGIGGIAGYNSTGTIRDVLSAVTFSLNPGGTSVYGIIGASYNSSVSNAWYLAKYGGICNSVSTGGSIVLEGKNGTIAAYKSASGAITFMQQTAESGYRAEFRTADERSVGQNDTYAPSPTGPSGMTVYARFVRPLSLIPFSSGDIKLISAVNGNEVVEGSYYEGQPVNAVIKVNSGYFLNKAEALSIYGLNTEFANITYVYDAYASTASSTVINISFVMDALIRELSAHAVSVGATPINDRYYDGEATQYSYAKPGYEDFIFENNFGIEGGGAPVNAGNNYKLTLFVKKDGIIRGKETISFNILKRPLEVPEAALTKVKEYDGVFAGVFVPIAVDQDIIAGHVSALGQNIVTMDIVVGGTNRVVVNAAADFNSMQIGDGKFVEYEFTLTGPSANNYQTPAMQAYNDGEIIKKTVVYEIYEDKGRLTRVFDGTPAAVTNYGPVFGKGGVSGQPVNPVIGFAKRDDLTPDAAVNVGEYVLTIRAGAENAAYYNAVFIKEYIFTVTPCPVQVTFTGTELTYNTAVQSIGGYYYDVDGVKQTLTADYFTYKYFDGTGYEDAELINAGLYIGKATLRGNYTAIDAEGEDGLLLDETYVTVLKAEQSGFLVDELTGSYTYGDAPILLSVSGGNGDGDITYSVTDGYGEIVDDCYLSFTGGGYITVKAVKAESANYLETFATGEVYVEKAVLAISLQSFSVGYGEDIIFDFGFDGFVPSDASLSAPAGFIAPVVKLDGVNFSSSAFYPVKYAEGGALGAYTVTIEQTAYSYGYRFDYSYFDDNTVLMTVNRKAITVRVNDAESTYGDTADAALTYGVYDGDILLGDGDHSVVLTLVRRPGLNAGQYEITCGTGTVGQNLAQLAAANPNYEITFIPGTYTVKPKDLVLTILGKYQDETRPDIRYNKKLYGEDDPQLVLGEDFTITGFVYDDTPESVITGNLGGIGESITRAPGENAFSTINPSLPYGYYVYRANELTVNTNYNLIFNTVNLRIYPAQPQFGQQQEILIQYGDPLSAIDPGSKITANSSGTLEWETPAVIPDFSGSPTLTFNVVFTSANRNYTDAVIGLVLGVIPRELTINFTGGTDLVYNGREQKTISYTILNVMEGDEINDVLTYYKGTEVTDSVKAAGVYRAVVTIDNGNYILTGDTEVTITIDKAPLEIYLDDIALPEGETPQKVFKYSGFVNDEDESSLLSLPDVVFHTEAGNYQITPFGASSDNYEITYRTSLQLVTKTKLTSPVSKFTLNGNFNNLMELKLAEIKRAENSAVFGMVSAAFETFKQGFPDLSKMKVAMLFDIGFTIDDEEAGLTGVNTATLELPVRLRETKKFSVILYMKDGTVKLAENVVRTGNMLSFDMTDCDYFAIVCPPDYTWIILLSVVAILFITVFVLDMVSEKLGIGRHSQRYKEKKAAKLAAKGAKK